MSKKVLYELSVEELIQAASEEKVFESSQATEVAKFIFKCGIKHGDARVPALVVYHTYRDWRSNYPQVIPTKAKFFRDFKKHFESVREKDGMYYLLNPEPFDLSKEYYFKCRASFRREKAKKKSKKKPNQQS